MAGNLFQLVLILDMESVKAAVKDLDDAVKAGARQAVTKIADAGVKLMQQMDAGAGHDYLADLWTRTEPFTDENGDLACVIYTEAEDRTFYARSGGTGQRSGNWPIKGADLVYILEYGAKRHAITPRRRFEIVNGRRVPARLRFRGARDEEDNPLPNTDYVGTAITKKGVQGGFLDNRGADMELVRTGYVDHPGFAGFGFLRVTKKLLEMRLKQIADETARDISVRMGG
jgi:hypothetical protein